jgi:hypothetical protein
VERIVPNALIDAAAGKRIAVNALHRQSFQPLPPKVT